MPDTPQTEHGLSGPSSQSANAWRLKTQTLHFGRLPALMGIINVTPDSFSDGGKFLKVNDAVDHALRLVEAGATLLDIGGESTRPYSAVVEASQEIDRVVPVIERLAKLTHVPISVDTSKACVAQAALEVGAEIINDVTGLEGDPKMIDVAVSTHAGICAMHMQGTPQTMQDAPKYQNVANEILSYLNARKKFLLDAGIELSRICLDPGIGFGKTHNHNLELINSCSDFHQLECPILVGHSRKGFIGKAMLNKEADRTTGTVAVTLSLARQRIQILRVHDVAANLHALRVFDAIGAIDGQTADLV